MHASVINIWLDFAILLSMSPSNLQEVKDHIANESQIREESETEQASAFMSLYLEFVADVPREYGASIYLSAVNHGVDPWDLAAVMISEKSGPDYDFSIEGGHKRHGTYHWDNTVVGQEGEIGFFQIKPRWARKAGYKADDLYDPYINIDVAGYVVATNMKSHEKCEKSHVTYHDWIAHYKCGKSDRNKFEGFCRFKQDNWLRIRESLGSVFSPDFKAINKGIKDELSAKQKYSMRNHPSPK